MPRLNADTAGYRWRPPSAARVRLAGAAPGLLAAALAVAFAVTGLLVDRSTPRDLSRRT